MGFHHARPVSWLAARARGVAFPGANCLAAQWLNDVTLTAYSRGGGCGTGPPDRRIGPFHIPSFIPNALRLSWGTLQGSLCARRSGRVNPDSGVVLGGQGAQNASFTSHFAVAEIIAHGAALIFWHGVPINPGAAIA